MRNAGLEEAPAGIKTAMRNISNLRYAHDTTLMAESEEELKSLLMKVKEEWKSWLKAQPVSTFFTGIWMSVLIISSFTISMESVSFLAVSISRRDFSSYRALNSQRC